MQKFKKLLTNIQIKLEVILVFTTAWLWVIFALILRGLVITILFPLSLITGRKLGGGKLFEKIKKES